jgi:hypothetical protein
MIVAVIVLVLWCVALTLASLASQSLVRELRQELTTKKIDTHKSKTIDPVKQLTCGCGHHFAFHHRKSGKCQETYGMAWNDTHHRGESVRRRCQCQGYTGYLPAEVESEIISLGDGSELHYPTTEAKVSRWTPS